MVKTLPSDNYIKYGINEKGLPFIYTPITQEVILDKEPATEIYCIPYNDRLLILTGKKLIIFDIDNIKIQYHKFKLDTLTYHATNEFLLVGNGDTIYKCFLTDNNFMNIYKVRTFDEPIKQVMFSFGYIMVLTESKFYKIREGGETLWINTDADSFSVEDYRIILKSNSIQRKYKIHGTLEEL